MMKFFLNVKKWLTGLFLPKPETQSRPSMAQPTKVESNILEEKSWLNLQFHDDERRNIKMPHELEGIMTEPPNPIDKDLLNRIAGSMIGMALGDALGAHVEFRPHQYLLDNPVTDLGSGGTWGLRKGQFTDDTSMALCLASSLVVKHSFILYDQLVRYKWWYKKGYMSSTGACFDIGSATRSSIEEFIDRQHDFAKEHNIEKNQIDFLSDTRLLGKFDVYCSEEGVAGNGALMRLAPVPLFFFRSPKEAVEYSGQSGQITHGDTEAYDACRYYGALIVAALQGLKKEEILDDNFYQNHQDWFDNKPLSEKIKSIAEGSFKKTGGYDDGIRGKGYIVNALEAALWAFWSDDNSFEKGALAAVNLGDDTDTTAAIYGQLAGAYYGLKELPQEWVDVVYAREFLLNLSKWLAYDKEMLQITDPNMVVLQLNQDNHAAKNNTNDSSHDVTTVNVPDSIGDKNTDTIPSNSKKNDTPKKEPEEVLNLTTQQPNDQRSIHPSDSFTDSGTTSNEHKSNMSEVDDKCSHSREAPLLTTSKNSENLDEDNKDSSSVLDANSNTNLSRNVANANESSHPIDLSTTPSNQQSSSNNAHSDPIHTNQETNEIMTSEEAFLATINQRQQSDVPVHSDTTEVSEPSHVILMETSTADNKTSNKTDTDGSTVLYMGSRQSDV